MPCLVQLGRTLVRLQSLQLFSRTDDCLIFSTIGPVLIKVLLPQALTCVLMHSSFAVGLESTNLFGYKSRGVACYNLR